MTRESSSSVSFSQSTPCDVYCFQTGIVQVQNGSRECAQRSKECAECAQYSHECAQHIEECAEDREERAPDRASSWRQPEQSVLTTEQGAHKPVKSVHRTLTSVHNPAPSVLNTTQSVHKTGFGAHLIVHHLGGSLRVARPRPPFLCKFLNHAQVLSVTSVYTSATSVYIYIYQSRPPARGTPPTAVPLQTPASRPGIPVTSMYISLISVTPVYISGMSVYNQSRPRAKTGSTSSEVYNYM